jgi:hypothetical protein
VLARGKQRREVGHHAAAGEDAFAERTADELGHPPHCLALEKVDRAARRGRVDVMGRGQRRSKQASLQASGADISDE